MVHGDAMEPRYLYLPVFRDRCEAGRLLALAVQALPDLKAPIVLALPRGGVPVGFEVAQQLGAPLDVLVVRKLGTPGQEELALGAVAFGGASFLNTDLVAELQLPERVIDEIRERALAEVMLRNRRYRGDRPWPDLGGRSAVIVDDGAATGATAEAAVLALRSQGPAEIVVALPVAPADTCDRLREAADRLVCLRSPRLFFALGSWYRDFEQVSDGDVRELLERSAETVPTGA